MAKRVTHTTAAWMVFFLSSLLALPCPSAQAVSTQADDYHLTLAFEPGRSSGTLLGTAELHISPDSRLVLTFPDMEVTRALLRDETGRESELLSLHDALILPPATGKRTLTVTYRKTVANSRDNFISPNGITLTSNWHPLASHPMRFRVSATLPDTFSAVTESDTFPLARKGRVTSSIYQKPVVAIHFAAGPYTMHTRQVRENLSVYSMFFPEDAELAEEYLQAAAGYLDRYEREIGPYPDNHYVIAANRLPTGLSMPTFTLLGQTVLRLPFIKNTSLGHEIVHSWFGNAVQVDYSQGNWCEGLTAHLSDHAFREEKGEGAADRKESITRYLSHVTEDSTIALESFTSASHNQEMAEAKRAVGYSRGALFFHELREKIGRAAFENGLRFFYDTYRGGRAGWKELQQSFSRAADRELDIFFKERLERPYIPHLAVDKVRVSSSDTGSVLSFDIVQKTEQPFTLVVPIRIKTLNDEMVITQEIRELTNPLTITLEQRPLSFTIDPELSFLRQLSPDELPATWSRFIGAGNKLVVLSREDHRQYYHPLIESLSTRGLTVVTADQVKSRDLSENNLLFLDGDQPAARSMFGPPSAASSTLTLDVRKNPLNPHLVAALVTADNLEDIVAAAGRLSHYGKYSWLQFSGGRNTGKRIHPTESGIRTVLEDLPMGSLTSTLSTFDQLVSQLAEARVVYVGETHTSFADHLLQLRIIEALHKKNPLLAIGMEMFPAAAQGSLDRYILGKDLDERSFLKDSGYYEVWRYDYRFFRDILNFARTKALPVIGLNLDRKIVSEIFRTGGTDTLDPRVRNSLPVDRDLDMAGYRERLIDIHQVHVQGGHGRGTAEGFLQAQAIWDESMAEKIVDFLQQHPNHRMVVLAGTQHTRKDSGIPPRVARRLPVRQASVLNLYNNSNPADLNLVADAFFLAGQQDLPPLPKIGVVLEPAASGDRASLRISELSPHSKAAASGLLAGDVLLSIDGSPIRSMSDIHIAMLDRHSGEMVDVRVVRTSGGSEQELDFRVELTVPPVLPPQP